MTSERGSAPVELALLTPMMVLLLLFVVFVGRLVTSEQDVAAAARDGARAASLRGTSTAAVADARSTVAAALATRDLSCNDLDIEVDTTQLRPGGSVAVVVRCTLSLADVAGLGVPGSRLVTARSAEVVDRYRGDES